MQLRLLDEVMDLGGRGIALLWMETEGEKAPCAGMKLRDARGNVHEVASISVHDQVTMLHLPKGDADYFGRLFRDIRIDATLFEEVSPCQ